MANQGFAPVSGVRKHKHVTLCTIIVEQTTHLETWGRSDEPGGVYEHRVAGVYVRAQQGGVPRPVAGPGRPRQALHAQRYLRAASRRQAAFCSDGLKESRYVILIK